MGDSFIDSTMEKTLTEQGEIMACSAGVSMLPMIRNKKDMVVIETVKRELKRSDVPVYRLASGKIVMHRILEVRPDVYVIRGDNLLDKEYIKPEQIIGVLKEFYRGGKHVNCADSKKYKLYVFWIMHSYWLRYLWKKIIRPILSKIKRFIFKNK